MAAFFDFIARRNVPIALVVTAILACGSKYSGFNLLVEMTGLVLLCALIAWGKWSPPMRLVAGYCGAMALLLLFQCLPLPTAIWSSLAGRELPGAITAYAGGGAWQAISLSPHRTLATLTTLIPVAAAAIWAAGASSEDRILFVRVVVALGFASAVLGVFQFASSSGYIRPTSHAGFATGFFSNRNHLGTFLAVCIGLVPAAFGPSHASSVGHKGTSVGRGKASFDLSWSSLASAAVAFLLIAAIATTSRAGILLAGLATLAVMWRLWMPARRLVTGRGIALAVAIAAALIVGLVLLMSDRDTADIFTRFATFGTDGRLVLWSNTWFAAQQYFPWGAGFGNFTEIYASVEDLATLRERNPNEAHSDFLQILLAGGLLAVLLGTVAICHLGLLSYRCIVTRAHRLLIPGVIVAIGIILVHSAVDYPLRSYAMLIPFAVLCGIVCAAAPVRTAR